MATRTQRKMTKAVKNARANARKYDTKLFQINKGESLEDAYKRLAKTADKRLLNLEKLAKEEGYKGATQFAYSRAAYDIKKYDKGDKGKVRFNRSMPANKKVLQAKVNDMLRFLNSPTSSKRGIEKVYKARADSLNRKYGTNFKWEDMSAYFEKGYFEKLAAKFGSKTAMQKIGEKQKEMDEMIKDIKDTSSTNEFVDAKDVAEKIFDVLIKEKVKL